MSPKGRPAVARLGSRLPDFGGYTEDDGTAAALAANPHRCECERPIGIRDERLGWLCLRCGHLPRQRPRVAST